MRILARMAESKHRRKAKSRPPRLIRAGDRTMTFLQTPEQEASDGSYTPSLEEVEAALADVPGELTWDWVAPRLIPLFERGYGEGVGGDPMVNIETRLGVGIGFGIDFGPAFGRVTRSMAQRWEASVEQIEAAAFAHLAEVASTVTRRQVQAVVHQGHLFRALGEPSGWASSLVLAGESELIRIFGARDQLFTVPSRGQLVAFGPGTPARAIGEVIAMLESLDPHPLLMDPFVMLDGTLTWEGVAEEELDDVI